MNLEKEVIDKLEKDYLIKKSVRIDNFDSFKISKFFLEKRDTDKVLILKGQESIFEYWIDQDLFIPPWQTHWFQLKDMFLIKLENNLLKNLLLTAIKKAGNLYRVCTTLKMSAPTFYNLINKKGVEMISIKKLRRLLRYLNIKYNYLNDKIEYTKKGVQISIEKPKFPINLATDEGARVLGMVVSDGCIYIDKKARNKLRTKYSNGEKQSIDDFICLINKIYGKTHIQKERIRNCDILKIGSSIIGETLLKVGAILSHKAKVNEKVPWLIRLGSNSLKSDYLRAVFDDEASIYIDKKKSYRSYIILSRYKHIKNLTKNQLKELSKLEKHMLVRKFPTGHINKHMSIKKALSLVKDEKLIQMLNSAPKLLLGESTLLKKFGIETRIWGRSLNLTSSGNYSLGFDMFINKKESIIKFYKYVDFSLINKQKKLLNLIKKWR